MRKTITIFLLLTAVFLSLFSCNGSYLDPYINNLRDGGFGPNVEYAIKIDIIDNESGDTLTVTPEKGPDSVKVTLAYTVANTKHYNQLDFGGVTAKIDSVEKAGSGTRSYAINARDSSKGIITITAVFTHTDLEIDHIAFEDTAGHITKTYGDAAFTNAVTTAHKGSGAITYHSSDTTVAVVDDSGQVTILKAGSAVISAEKAADDVYAHAQTTYTLTVNPKPVTITGLSANNKVYDGTTKATVTGTAVINGLVDGDTVTVIAGTASFANAAVGNNKTVTFSGWSLGGADAGNYILSAQPENVTAAINNNNNGNNNNNNNNNNTNKTLGGNISISPNSGVTIGMELTATYSGSEAVSYQWRKDGVVVGTNSKKFTPAAAGSYTVTVSTAGYNSKTSAAVVVGNPVLVEYTIVIDMFDNATGDTVTATPNKGFENTSVTLSYTVADTKHNNQLDFGGVTATIASATSAGTGTRTYTINASDASNKVITITATFTHTDLEIDHIAFNEHDGGHITKTYGDEPFTNAVKTGPTAHKGTGAITYHSSNESVATVDSTGKVTILAVGSTVISAEKAADATYAHATTTYTLTVNPKLGTADNPFLVTNETELRKVGTGTDGWTLSAHYRQTQNITMTTGSFPPIGNNTNKFTGVYDGGGHTVTGLSMTISSTYIGLFGANSGTVKNMNVSGTVTTDGTNRTNIGGIAGANDGTIDNCVFNGTISGSGTTNDQIGGIVGQNTGTGTVKNSRNTATVSGRNQVGGIAGWNIGKIENSYNTGAVSGNNQIGGITGLNNGENENNYNTGNISGNQQVGGIAGTNSGSGIYIKNCYNTGTITATAAANTRAGGIAGDNLTSAVVEYCYNTGNVSGANLAGGIAGYNDTGCNVRYCVSLGARIISTGSTTIGRVVGSNSGTLTANKGRADMDGVSGTATGTTTHGENVSVGQTQTYVFSSFFATTIWTLGSNLTVGGNLPILQMNTQSPAPTLPAAYTPPGTADNPFLVTNEAELRKVGTGTDGWTLSAHYKQTANITLSSSNFTPIGNNTNRFTGTYDGDGKTITGLPQVITSGNAGFFSYIGTGGTVKNVTVTNGTITQNGSNTSYTGGIAGINEGTIDNCSFSGNVTGGTTNDDVGGIAGRNYNNGTVINSRNTATVSGKTRVGGIVGQNNGKIDNSYNTGAVTGSQQVGGIAGGNSDSGNYIKNCYNTGNVTATTATTTANAGGIVGQSSALIEYCYNTGNVSGTGNIGGIVGYKNPGSNVQNCVSLGARVTGDGNVGRVAGTNNGGTLYNNAARQDMKIGASGAEAVPTTNTGTTAINGAGAGISLNTLTAVFSGWDTALWNISGNLTIGVNLPTLKPNTQSPAPTLPAEYIVPGTASNPFLVATVADLRKVGTGTDGWTVSAHYKQTANISMTGGNFPRIGSDTAKFTGSYDGNGYTITNLSMTVASPYHGLFAYIAASGTVKNVSANGTVTASTGTYINIGGIAGINEGTVDNCSFGGTVNVSSLNQVGGVVGYNFGTIINSRNTATVSGRDYVGGITGSNKGKIDNCYNTGTISGNSQIGGIAGTNEGGASGRYIKNCYNTGNITANNTIAGGIAGYNQDGAELEYCYNTGNISASSITGGIVGNNWSATLQNCVSLGAKVTGSSNTGRVMGVFQGTSTLSANRARSDMKIGANGTEAAVPSGSTGPSGLNGSDVTVGSSTALSTVFTSFNSTTIWNINSSLNTITGGALPTLKTNTQSPAPTLPGDPVLGTAANPFLVANETDLRKVGTETAAGGWTLSAHYKQTQNITMTTSNFPKIGTSSTQFIGTYDGDGKTITGLTMTATPTVYFGLFSSIGAAGIVKNMNVTGTITQSGYTNMGGIAGGNDGTIDNCSFSGTINGGTYDQVGGIVGLNNGTVKNSRNTATVSGRNQVGGIAGRNNGKIENSYNRGAVSGNQIVGGIVGENNSSGADIKNCYNTGDVTATNNTVGGITGANSTGALVEYCYNTGNVSSTAGNSVGGIVGGNSSGSNVQNCVTLGARVTGTGNVGRVAGNSPGTLANNTARSDMKIGASGAEAAVSPAGDNTPNGSTVMFSVNLSIVYSGWDTAVWNISGTFTIGGNLATLKTNTQSPAPTVPPAYIVPGSPDGTAGNPFLVANETDLRRVGRPTATDGWPLTAHYRQTANITMTGSFTPIGNTTDRFTGTYDGGGYTITGLSMTSTSSNLGLFGYIGDGGTVKNMNVTGTITQNGAVNTGGIAGSNAGAGTIENCVFNGTVSGGTNYDQVGGIVGFNFGTVINSRNNATISGKNIVGGIAGVNQGKLENSYNTENVSGTSQVGGIAGTNTGSGNYIKNSYNTGIIIASATANTYVGGIVGSNISSATVEYCYNSGNVTGASGVGGIAGNSASAVRNCTSLGAKITTTTNSTLTGRIVGNNSGTLAGNTARADMKVGVSGGEAVSTANIGAADRNGASVTVGTAQSSFYLSWDTAVWNMGGNLTAGVNLATLKTNTQSPAPTLPAEYIVPGTAANPFQVATAADLRKVGTETTTGGWTLSAHYKQTANISMTGSFTPIGTTANRFTGSYDGDGKTITNLSISASGSYSGLFGYIGAGGTVKNVSANGVISSSGSYVSIGGIAGENAGTIDNCSFGGTVNGSPNSDQVGGITGQNNGTVKNSRNTANVSGRNQVGGIAGTGQGKIDESYNTGNVTGNQQVGGIAGTNVGSGNYIKNSYNTGSVTSTAGSNSNAGGITGFNQQSALLEYCYNTGYVAGSDAVGGIAGNSASGTTVKDCISLASKLTGSTSIGRVVGNNGGATLTNNKARSDMRIGYGGTEATVSGTATNANGANTALGTQVQTVFTNFSGSIWYIWNLAMNAGGDLPTLRKKEQSPAPTLPVSS